MSIPEGTASVHFNHVNPSDHDDADTAARLVVLLRKYFLDREDVLAHLTPNGTPCPLRVGEGQLDTLLASHLTGAYVVARAFCEKNPDGWDVCQRMRLGTYSPALDGTTNYACLDFDGGGHSNPLADPLGSALQVMDLLRAAGLACHLERSKDGSGWHVWVFF